MSNHIHGKSNYTLKRSTAKWKSENDRRDRMVRKRNGYKRKIDCEYVKGKMKRGTFCED